MTIGSATAVAYRRCTSNRAYGSRTRQLLVGLSGQPFVAQDAVQDVIVVLAVT